MQPNLAPMAVMGHWVATDLVEVSDDAEVLEESGRWAVLITFEGHATFARFRSWERRTLTTGEVGEWNAPAIGSWRSSLSEPEYRDAVSQIRRMIAMGEVYQANVCRILRAELDDSSDLLALYLKFARHNPAPHSGALRINHLGIQVASASPELFLRRNGEQIESHPIKGTGSTATQLRPKDQAENVMIVDLIRNDLSRICRTGTVEVPELLSVQHHPGLVHLVSSIRGQLTQDLRWNQIFAATFPPGSVSGAPKLAALAAIGQVESQSRGPYCGAFGWVDADHKTAELAVAIRTFWREDGHSGANLAFGTGAGITWSSDAGAEWRETELKASRLIRIASDLEVT